MAIKGVYAGRIEMVLFVKDSPLASENFRLLCTGGRERAREGGRHWAGRGWPHAADGTGDNRVCGYRQLETDT